jgi:SHS2 domain-containing protein
MPFHYRDDLTTADIAFQAYGDTIEELFSSAWQAMLKVMVTDIKNIKKSITRNITLEGSSLQMLLLAFLQESLFYKDAQQLFLDIENIVVTRHGHYYKLEATLKGETIRKTKHRLGCDVKAVTLHKYNLAQTERGWQATVVLDV